MTSNKISSDIVKDKRQNPIIKKMLKNTLYNSTAQACIKLFETDHYLLKAILLFYLMLVFAMSSYLVIQSALSYLSFEVYTTTKFVSESPMNFPSVTICNRLQFTTKDSFEFLKSESKKQLNYDLFDFETSKNMSYEQYSNLLEKLKQSMIGKTNHILGKQRENLYHSKNDMFISCKFNGKNCDIDKDFTYVYVKRFKNCFVFNKEINSIGNDKEIKYSTMGGPDYGLKVTLYVNYYENLSIFNSLGALGVRMSIDNTTNFNENIFSGVRVSSGDETDIAIERNFKYNLPKPYSNCDIDNKYPPKIDSLLYNLILKSGYEYTQQQCFRQCFQMIMIENCNCTDPNIMYLLNTTDCETIPEVECKDKVLFDLTSSFATKCLPLCPLECKSTEYKLALSSNRLIGDLYVKYIREKKNLSRDFVNRPINSETARESIVKLNIYYESLTYNELIDTPKMDLVSLLANIGGVLSLCLGVSVFSIFEILILSIEIFYLKAGK